ncbi:hypothetical protein EBU24_03270 [bacterium]|nr:hypothetical protein [bacterium]
MSKKLFVLALLGALSFGTSYSQEEAKRKLAARVNAIMGPGPETDALIAKMIENYEKNQVVQAQLRWQAEQIQKEARKK